MLGLSFQDFYDQKTLPTFSSENKNLMPYKGLKK